MGLYLHQGHYRQKAAAESSQSGNVMSREDKGVGEPGDEPVPDGLGVGIGLCWAGENDGEFWLGSVLDGDGEPLGAEFLSQFLRGGRIGKGSDLDVEGVMSLALLSLLGGVGSGEFALHPAEGGVGIGPVTEPLLADADAVEDRSPEGIVFELVVGFFPVAGGVGEVTEPVGDVTEAGVDIGLEGFGRGLFEGLEVVDFCLAEVFVGVGVVGFGALFNGAAAEVKGLSGIRTERFLLEVAVGGGERLVVVALFDGEACLVEAVGGGIVATGWG